MLLKILLKSYNYIPSPLFPLRSLTPLGARPQLSRTARYLLKVAVIHKIWQLKRAGLVGDYASICLRIKKDFNSAFVCI